MYSRNKKNYDEDIDLRQTWSVISRNKWPILSFAGMVSAIAAWLVYSMAPVFTASATVLIESQEANVISIEEVYALDTQTQQPIVLLKERLSAPDVPTNLPIRRLQRSITQRNQDYWETQS